MIVGTTIAANILNISTSRLRVLLSRDRIKGAYKSGKMWFIPLFNGKPFISKGKRGPTPNWSNPRVPAKTKIHVNAPKIKQNQKRQEFEPVITVKKGGANQYAHEVEILGGCRIIYSPDKPFAGARVWIETLYDVRLFDREALSQAKTLDNLFS